MTKTFIESETYLFQTTKLFHVIFVVDCSLHEFPAISSIRIDDAVGAGAAAVIASASYGDIGKGREEASDLMGDKAKRMVTPFIGLGDWRRSSGSVGVLQDRHKQLY